MKMFLVHSKGVSYLVCREKCMIQQQGSVKHLKKWAEKNDHMIVTLESIKES